MYPFSTPGVETGCIGNKWVNKRQCFSYIYNAFTSTANKTDKIQPFNENLENKFSPKKKVPYQCYLSRLREVDTTLLSF